MGTIEKADNKRQERAADLLGADTVLGDVRVQKHARRASRRLCAPREADKRHTVAHKTRTPRQDTPRSALLRGT